MTTLIQWPQGPIADDTGYFSLEWQQWLQNPQVISLALGFVIDVASGGTGVNGGTSGGVLAFTGTQTISSSGLLDQNEIVVGGGVGGVPSTPIGLGTVTTLLHGNAAGAPSFGQVVNADIANGTIDLTSKVTGVLPAANGGSVGAVPITNSLSGNVALNNTGTYFDGPQIAQGTTGTWFVSGTVSVQDTAGAATIDVKLWDGTTVIASAIVSIGGANFRAPVALSGFIASPAGDLRLSAKDITSTSGLILSNGSGNAADSTITAFRIA